MTDQTTLDLLRDALAKGGEAGNLAKAATFIQSTTATTGLTEYDLEAVAKNLYPVLTPLRNMIPRVSGRGGLQANWKGVTAINPTLVDNGVQEGLRGGVIGVNTKDYMAIYRTLGLEDSVTFEAELAAEGFDDLKARAVNSLLQAAMIAEEKVLLAGNGTYSIGITPTPALVASGGGGSLGAATWSLICVGLTYQGTVLNTMASGLYNTISRPNADGSTTTFNAGTCQKSTNATVATTGATSSIVGSVAPMQGVYGYAWYFGAAGQERLYSITKISQVTITSSPSGTQLAAALAATDCSANSLVHDGLLGFIANPSNGCYYYAQTPGLGLTGDGTGGILEFDTALQYFWDVQRLSPSKIMVASQEMLYIRKKILGGANSSSNARFTFNVNNGQIVGGGKPKGYLNPFAMSGGPSEIDIEMHPNMPPGTVLFLTDKLPYPMANISNIMQVRCRRDYYQTEWPRRTRQYEYGVYSDQVLQHYFTPSMGVITNLSPA